MTADEILSSLTVDQLKAGIKRANDELRTIDILEQTEDMFGDGPFPLSRDYEWSAKDYAYRRLGLGVAINESLRELSRRGIV